MKRPPRKPPRTREHTARLTSRDLPAIEISLNETPDDLLKWASKILARFDSPVGSEAFWDLVEYKSGDPDLQDIAWCAVHGGAARQKLAAIPKEFRKNAVLACIHMYQAGKRHESFDEYRKHALAIEEKKSRGPGLVKATKKSADSRRLITPEKFARAYRPGLSNERMAEEIGVTPQALGKWRRENGK
jgi:hypothetical protein